MGWMRRRPAGTDPDEVRYLHRTIIGHEPPEEDVAKYVQWPLERVVSEFRAASTYGGDPALVDGELQAIYLALLGRAPRATELADAAREQLTLPRVVRMLLDSDEHATFAAAAEARRTLPARPNIRLPETARYMQPIGSISHDRVAVVGHEGVCFVRAGRNNALEHHLGRGPLPDGWLEDWTALVARRTAQAAEAGTRLGMIVVPDKLAVCGELFPEPLEPVGPRPIELLLPAVPEVLYPLDELRAGDSYLRTDSHLTRRGNTVLHDAACRAVGVEPPDPFAGLTLHEYFAYGDLGGRFEPPIGEMLVAVTDSPAELVEDNRDAIDAAGGHLGTRRVWRNPQAPRPETVVVFGDSYAFGDLGYHGLAWLLAQSFAEVHFCWASFGWDPEYVRAAKPDIAIAQIAERFIQRVPRAEVDVRELERQALGQRVGLDPDVAFR